MCQGGALGLGTVKRKVHTSAEPQKASEALGETDSRSYLLAPDATPSFGLQLPTHAMWSDRFLYSFPKAWRVHLPPEKFSPVFKTEAVRSASQNQSSIPNQGFASIMCFLWVVQASHFIVGSFYMCL